MAKLTPKQEAFIRAYLETGNASEAYRRAYITGKMKPSTIWRNAHALLGNNKVATRLAELQSAAQKRHDVTLDSITAFLFEDRELARERGQSGAAVAATMGLAKLHGLIIDRSERGKPGEFADMSDAELATIARYGSSRGNGVAEKANGAAKPDRFH